MKERKFPVIYFSLSICLKVYYFLMGANINSFQIPNQDPTIQDRLIYLLVAYAIYGLLGSSEHANATPYPLSHTYTYYEPSSLLPVPALPSWLAIVQEAYTRA